MEPDGFPVRPERPNRRRTTFTPIGLGCTYRANVSVIQSPTEIKIATAKRMGQGVCSWPCRSDRVPVSAPSILAILGLPPCVLRIRGRRRTDDR
jgi:hypothetical protein